MSSTDYSNKVGDVLAEHRLDKFEVLNPSHKEALTLMQSLAKQIVTHAREISTLPRPLHRSILVVLHGQPGRGKTHLAEGFINAILYGAPSLSAKIHLSRQSFSYDHHESGPYEGKHIVVIEDMFLRKDPMARDPIPTSVAALARKDFEDFGQFIVHLYEQPKVVIVTNSFPILKAGIMGGTASHDITGRIKSRSLVVLQTALELELTGDDYRERIAARARPSRMLQLEVLAKATIRGKKKPGPK